WRAGPDTGQCSKDSLLSCTGQRANIILVFLWGSSADSPDSQDAHRVQVLLLTPGYVPGGSMRARSSTIPFASVVLASPTARRFAARRLLLLPIRTWPLERRRLRANDACVGRLMHVSAAQLAENSYDD